MGLIGKISSDIAAVRKNDPAAKGTLDVLINHMPLHAIAVYRIVHPFYNAGFHVLPRFLSNLAKFWSGAEMHPGAQIGGGFFIDHGTGVVIGETAEIGNDCVIFHNVTLGGTGKHIGKRHPTVGNNVLIGTGATILGPLNIGNNVKIGAETFIMMKDVPAGATVVGVPGRIVKLNGKKVNLSLKPTKFREK
ncbi:MAG TPA: serine O-acetyltransferase EpsC [archaeon]|nr:serine O-acetyltransferase EpsC [archaeon]